VSFAGEDRKYVEDFVRRLQSLSVAVFYDEDELAAIWGENLVDFLEAVYTRRARYAILFVSHTMQKRSGRDTNGRACRIGRCDKMRHISFLFDSTTPSFQDYTLLSVTWMPDRWILTQS
jgi:hypothetical protein